MEDPIYIIGHKNPDADSICSAIAYAALKEIEGHSHYIPARCGNTNTRINTILERFNVPAPTYLGDVTPRAADIMIPHDKAYTIQDTDTYAQALEIIDKYDIRSLPVISADKEPIGSISIFQLGEYFIPKPAHTKRLKFVETSIDAISKSLNAEVLHSHEASRSEELYIRVGAMATETFSDFSKLEAPASQCITIVSNRRDIQELAIEFGVRLIVITGDRSVDDDIITKAKENNINLILSKYDVAATTWIIRSATPVTASIQKDLACFNAEEKLSQVKKRIINSTAPLFFVTDEKNKFLGVFSKSDILTPTKKKLILVDHNEMSQAVTGADEVDIVEIIDHHRLGNPTTKAPIRFHNEPVGSTSTIIANMFRAKGIDPSPSIAGIMMGGIITDTLNLNSPTTTDVDREILSWLGTIADITPNELFDLIFKSGSVILNSQPRNVIESDCKIFEENSVRYSASQVEELGFTNFWDHSDSLIEALEDYRKRENLAVSFLLVTDINTQDSLLVVQGNDNVINSIKYPKINNQPIFELKSVVSRKKQLIPYITTLLTESGAVNS